MSLGSRIKKLRIKFKLTQSELAQCLSLSNSAIGMYERNERQPDNEILLKIANSFRK